VEHHAEVLSGGVWRQRIPSWRDLVATLLVLGMVILLGIGAHEMVAPFVAAHQAKISLSPAALPFYTLRTVMRMLAALILSLIFTLTYATLAGKSRRAEMVLIPLLDVLQSVPILGYLSFTVVFFISLFPGNTLGPELAAIFAIFTSQAWNMAFSFYQALRTVPLDLDEASRSFRSSAWQRFRRLEVPFAMPGLVWNMMMSMSGGWFFVVASEAISVGDVQIALPGVGSYVARAIQERDLAAVGWAIVAMTIAIIIYDQLLFRPMVVWADKFRFEQTAAQIVPKSVVLELFRRSRLLRGFDTPVGTALHKVARARLSWPRRFHGSTRWSPPRRILDFVWYGLLTTALGYVVCELGQYARSTLSLDDVTIAAGNGALTLLRVAILIALASAIWVPTGVAVGLQPKVRRESSQSPSSSPPSRRTCFFRSPSF
jgi:NitT/TauT family transport system permease protein